MDLQFSVRQALQDDGTFSSEEVEAAAKNVARSLGRDLKTDFDPAMLKLKVRHLNIGIIILCSLGLLYPPSAPLYGSIVHWTTSIDGH